MSEAQRRYISYNVMEAAATTNDVDMPGIEFYYTKKATFMGDYNCKDWFGEELDN